MEQTDWKFTMTNHAGEARFELLDNDTNTPYGTVIRRGDRFHAQHDRAGDQGSFDTVEDAFTAIDDAN